MSKKTIKIGNILVGGGNLISIQSMTNTHTENVVKTIRQIHELTKAGCEIVRVTANNFDAAQAIAKIKMQTNLPIVADIHFDYKLALEAIKAGADGLRLNPGNIGSMQNVLKIVNAAKGQKIPIRIGVNSGSLSKKKIAKYGISAEALVESALEHVAILEKANYEEIKISVKASSVPLTLKSYRLLAQKVDYPLHLGITEAGTEFGGTIKSAIGIGTLLEEGIGDTIRVSLTANPVKEVLVAKEILKALNLRKGLKIISCPTCGRTEINLISIANKVEKQLQKYAHLDLKIAVMGCIVNGPGEAREADFGIAGGNGEGLIFQNGKIVKKVTEDKLIEELIHLIEENAS